MSNNDFNGTPVDTKRFNQELEKIWRKIDDISNSIDKGFAQLNNAIVGNQKYKRQGIIDQVENNNDNLKELYSKHNSLHKSVDGIRECVTELEKKTKNLNANSLDHLDSLIDDNGNFLKELKSKVESNKSFTDRTSGAIAAVALIMSLLSLALKFLGG